MRGKQRGKYIRKERGEKNRRKGGKKERKGSERERIEKRKKGKLMRREWKGL